MDFITEVKCRLYVFEKYRKELSYLSYYEVFLHGGGVHTDDLVEALKEKGVELDDYMTNSIEYCSKRVVELKDGDKTTLNYLLSPSKFESPSLLSRNTEINGYASTMLTESVVVDYRRVDRSDIWCRIKADSLVKRGIPVLRVSLDGFFPILVTEALPIDLIETAS